MDFSKRRKKEKRRKKKREKGGIKGKEMSWGKTIF